MQPLYTKGLEIFSSLFFRKKQDISPYYCYLDIADSEILLSYGIQVNDKKELQGCVSLNYANDQLLPTLTSWVKDHNLQGANCTWVLRSPNYQLLLLDVLPVPPEEMRAAIYWKIKPLLTFPIEDAVYDYFLLPPAKSAGTPNIMIVAVSSMNYLNSICQLISQSGLKLTKIDIPELVLKEICGQYENYEHQAALIYLQDNAAYFVITREKSLFMNRHLEFNLESLHLTKENLEERIDKLALEIQRSFDYFQAHFRLPVPTNSYISSNHISSIDISNLLIQRLTVPLQVLDIKGHIQTRQDLSIEKQGKYLMVLSPYTTQIESEAYATAD